MVSTTTAVIIGVSAIGGIVLLPKIIEIVKGQPPPDSTVDSIALSPDATTKEVNQTFTLTAVAKNAAGTALPNKTLYLFRGDVSGVQQTKTTGGTGPAAAFTIAFDTPGTYEVWVSDNQQGT